MSFVVSLISDECAENRLTEGQNWGVSQPPPCPVVWVTGCLSSQQKEQNVSSEHLEH